MKRILLAISGMSPQIITETLYCLRMEGRDVDAIHVITTRSGKDLLQAGLLDSGRGAFFRFCADYGVDAGQVDFSRNNIHIPQDGQGRDLPDIVDQAGNEALLSLCLRLARELTADADAAVYFLVAGGRKTMTSCLSFAAQIYGRPQDRMYHVLVSPEFENCSEFWFPPKTPQRLELRDRQGRGFWMETSQARVQLISLPFLSLRKHLPGALLDGLHNVDKPGALMAQLVREEERIFVISLADRTISCGTLQMDVKPAWLALLAFFAEIRLESTASLPQNRADCPAWFLETTEVLERQERLTELYTRIVGPLPEAMSDTGITSLNADNFASYKAKLRRALVDAFGPLGDALAILPCGQRPNTRYGIRLEKNRLRLKM